MKNIFEKGQKFATEITNVISTSDGKVFYRLEGFENILFDEDTVYNLENLTYEYVNENFDSLMEATYEDGLFNAWNVITKLFLGADRGGFSEDDFTDCFGSGVSLDDVISSYTVKEIIDKVSSYQEECKRNRTDKDKNTESPVKGQKVYSVKEYCSKFLGFELILEKTRDELRLILDSNGYENIWDYPLDEIKHIVENNLNVVLVDVSYVDGKSCKTMSGYRWVEIPE